MCGAAMTQAAHEQQFHKTTFLVISSPDPFLRVGVSVHCYYPLISWSMIKHKTVIQLWIFSDTANSKSNLIYVPNVHKDYVSLFII